MIIHFIQAKFIDYILSKSTFCMYANLTGEKILKILFILDISYTRWNREVGWLLLLIL